MVKHLLSRLIQPAALCLTLSLSLISPLQAAPFYFGAGGYELCPEGDTLSSYRPDCPNPHIPVTGAMSEMLPGSNTVTIWITRDWQKEWYSAELIQQRFIDQGYTPVFMFYWFADEISPQFVEANRDQYLDDLYRFTRFLKTIPGEKLVVLNPEFNQNGINSYAPFNDLLIESMELVRLAKNTQVSFCIGDFGQYDLIQDPVNWQAFDPAIRRAAEVADFISFQEMRALTRNPPSHIANTAKRSLAFARYLHQTYDKPVYFAYLALSTHGKGATDLQTQVMRELGELMPEFRRDAGLIGISNFHLLDVPGHQGYFNEAEPFFGLLDKAGNPKPGLKAFRALAHPER